MELRDQILKLLKTKGEIRVRDIQRESGLSRVYINRILQQLREEGLLVKVGKARATKYVPAVKEKVAKAKAEIVNFKKTYTIANVSEDVIYDEISADTGIVNGLKNNVETIYRYAITEIINNAIDHSKSKEVKVASRKTGDSVVFEVVDRGIGIFANIMKGGRLKNELEAIWNLLKGKQTTDPTRHSGEGIFFTSKLADVMTIQSHDKKLVFDNVIGDVFIEDRGYHEGTRVTFGLGLHSARKMEAVFRKFTDQNFRFNKTKVVIKLYEFGQEFISRSQARRLVVGLEKFSELVLDFKKVKTVGQGFVDEIWRVWHRRNPNIKIEVINANENIRFMIDRS